MFNMFKRHKPQITDTSKHLIMIYIDSVNNYFKSKFVSYLSRQSAGLSNKQRKVCLFIFAIITCTFFIYLIISGIVENPSVDIINHSFMQLPPVGMGSIKSVTNKH